MSEERVQMNIYQKLAKIRKQVEVIKKNKKGYGYKYVTEDEILAKITGGMDKYGLSLIPGVVPDTTSVEPYHYIKTKTTSNGEIYEEHNNEVLVSADMTWTWVNNDNPDERIVVPWSLVGQQGDASPAFGSGLTYSSRYFLWKYFNVATTEELEVLAVIDNAEPVPVEAPRIVIARPFAEVDNTPAKRPGIVAGDRARNLRFLPRSEAI